MSMQKKYFQCPEKIKNRLLPCILLASLALPMATLAQELDDDVNEKEWKEISLQFPLPPKAEDLVVFYQNGNQSFSLDTKSLSVGKDGAVRYTLVSTSNTGAKNISYEGLRCETAEKKLYAFGRADGTWSRSRRNQWDAISGTDFNKQHITLTLEYFCEGKTIAGKAEQIVGRMKRNQPLKSF
jgi:CNP1-like family